MFYQFGILDPHERNLSLKVGIKTTKLIEILSQIQKDLIKTVKRDNFTYKHTKSVGGTAFVKRTEMRTNKRK